MSQIVSQQDPVDGYERSVFINCPFDDAYKPLLRSLLFTVVYLDFKPRIATERADSYENRLSKICELIREAKYSIHDVSRLQSKRAKEFSRMNMPFELGIDYGSRQHGPDYMRSKKCLILETKPYDFKKALSDLSGVDIKAHADEPDEVVRAVRDWFLETVGIEAPFPKVIWYRFTDFTTNLYDARLATSGLPEAEVREDLERMPIPEFLRSIENWIGHDRKDLT